MRKIVVGQKVDAGKVELAKRLRQQMTPEESILWQHLRGGAIDGLRFRRQQVIDGFIADFFCAAAGLVVEVDGAVHLQQAEYDTERDLIVQRRDLQVMRITNNEVQHELSGVLERIAQICSQRLAGGGKVEGLD